METKELFGIFYININGKVKEAKVCKLDFSSGIRNADATFITPSGERFTASSDNGYGYGSGNIGGLKWSTNVPGTENTRFKVLYRNKRDAALLNDNVVSSNDFFTCAYNEYMKHQKPLECIFEFSKETSMVHFYKIVDGIIHQITFSGYAYIVINDGEVKPRIRFYKDVDFGVPTADIKETIKMAKEKGYFLTRKEAETFLLDNFECECFNAPKKKEETQCEKTERIRKNLHKLIDEAEGESLDYIAKVINS